MSTKNQKSEEKLINPYDFSNPVNHLIDLAGRENEVEQIKKCLADGKMSIALIGIRGIGKTSFLNATAELADQLSYFSAKVKLDGALVKNEYIFFRELYVAIIEKLFKKEKISEKEYNDFRQIIDSYDDKINPFFLKFPKSFVSYFKHKIEVPIPRTYLHDDLAALVSKAGTQIVILLDECDFFAENKELLQCLRQILQSVKGITFVLTGTEKMFPNMEDVFSPVPRQFKRIDIKGFNDLSQTMDLVFKPFKEIENISIERETLRDLHTIAEGNPYELKVLCHYLWESSKDKEKINFRLKPNIFADVANEMQSFAPMHHNFVSEVKKLSPHEFSTIIDLIKNEKLNINEKAALNLAFNKEGNEDIQSLSASYKESARKFSKFLELTDEETIQFKGENFEKVFLKYIAQSHFKDKGIKWKNHPFALALLEKLTKEIISKWCLANGKPSINVVYMNDRADLNAKDSFFNDDYKRSYHYFENINNPLPEQFYKINSFVETYIKFDGNPSFHFLKLTCETHGGIATALINIENIISIDELVDELKSFEQNEFKDFGIKFEYKLNSFKTLPYDKIYNFIHEVKIRKKEGYEKLLEVLENVSRRLFIFDKPEKSAEVFEKMLELQGPNFSTHNNLSFVYIKLDKFDEAKTHLEKASNLINKKSNVEKFLLNYNLASLYIFQGKIPEAKKLIKNIKTIGREGDGAILFKFYINESIIEKPFFPSVSMDVALKLITAYIDFELKENVAKIENELLADYKEFIDNPDYLNGLCSFYKKIGEEDKFEKYNYLLERLE